MLLNFFLTSQLTKSWFTAGNSAVGGVAYDPDPNALAVTAGGSPTLIIIAAVAGALLVLVLLAFFARIGAYSRHVDHRRVRRAKFQDEWTGIIRAADKRARELRDRQQK